MRRDEETKRQGEEMSQGDEETMRQVDEGKRRSEEAEKMRRGRRYYSYLHTLEMTVPEKLLICYSPLILEILRWILT